MAKRRYQTAAELPATEMYGGVLHKRPADAHRRFFTIAEAAHKLRVTRKTIHKWLKAGTLPGEKFGRRTLIPQSAQVFRPE